MRRKSAKKADSLVAGLVLDELKEFKSPLALIQHLSRRHAERIDYLANLIKFLH
jgi:hypothetical protein